MNASIRTPAAVATPICWMKEIDEVMNAPIATASRIDGGGDDRAGALDADGDRLAIAAPAVARLLDAPEQEDAVVGREREHERGGDEEVGRLDAAVAGVAEQALEAAVLEDEREDAERASRPSARSSRSP